MAWEGWFWRNAAAATALREHSAAGYPVCGFDHSGRTGAAVETVTREVRTESSSGGAPGATARLHFSPAYAPIELGPLTDLDAPTTIRLGLQRRAAANLRSHVLRAMRRVTPPLLPGPPPFFLIRGPGGAGGGPGPLGGGGPAPPPA